ncbi:MAG: DUF1415 domain-containing protein [Gammaproteobacteria bacterium]|nr:DUF1415 domain-containing protein [Gammaproteobacteria bacterium]
MNEEIIIKAVQNWIKTFIVELNLCPFAKREVVKNRVRYVATEATTEEQLLAALAVELELLSESTSIETTLLIHANVLSDFYDYNQFLGLADGLLQEMKFDGVFQIASFHPQYQFSGTDASDAENYTNRSPYPILHLLREESMEQAIAEYADADKIPTRNIALMNDKGVEKLKEMLSQCIG